MAPDRPAGFREVFAVAEYRALWLSALLSRVGDQLARVALALLTFNRTGSAVLTTLVYSLTFVPALLGGPLLGGLADRFPRRRVMVSCDVARTGLIALMAVPHAPFAVLCILLFTAQLLDSPENAARSATTPVVLAGDRLAIGIAASQMMFQAGGLVGFAVGGVVVAATGAPVALVLDAATFALSAGIVFFGVENRPAAQSGTGPDRVVSGVKIVVGDRRLRSLLGLALLAGFYVVPTALAVPYAAQAHLGAGDAGLLMAALPAGNVIGVAVLNRFVSPATRLRCLGPLAVLASLPLVICAFHPGLAESLAAWSVSGALTSYQVVANAAFVRRVSNQVRGRVMGLAGSLLTAVQGLGMIIAGLAAASLGPDRAIAACGTAGVIVGIPVAMAWNRTRNTTPTGVVSVEVPA